MSASGAAPHGHSIIGSGSGSGGGGGGGGPNRDVVYHQTIVPSQHIVRCVAGTFTVPGSQDLLVLRHQALELWTLHPELNKLELLHATRLFANVYDVAAVPVTYEQLQSGRGKAASASRALFDAAPSGGQSPGLARALPQFIAVTSETGYVVILKYRLHHPYTPGLAPPLEGGHAAAGPPASGPRPLSAAMLSGEFVRLSEIGVGRSGARLTVPGYHLAVDPHGRALLVTALMRFKYVIPLTTEAAGGADGTGEPGSRGGRGRGDEGREEVEEAEEEGRGGGPSLLPTPRQLGDSSHDMTVRLCTPVEAHRNTVIYSICSLEGCLDNAVFVALEQEIVTPHSGEDAAPPADSPPASASAAAASSAATGRAFLRGVAANPTATAAAELPPKQLVVYEYAHGLHQVHRTHLLAVAPMAHRLVPVPAPPFGPGGVLVCTDTELLWYDILQARSDTGILDAAAAGGVVGVSVFKASTSFPRRMHFMRHPLDPMIIASAVTRVRNDMFLLLQDEVGDVYRVTLSVADVRASYDAIQQRERCERELQRRARMSPQEQLALPPPPPMPPAPPSPLVVHYFDTMPAVTSMVLFRTGFLFTASESYHSHGLRKIIKDGFSSDREYVVKVVKVEEVSHDTVPSLPPPPPPSSSSSSPAAVVKKAEDEEPSAAVRDATGSVKTESVKQEPSAEGPDGAPSAAPAKTADGFLIPSAPARAPAPAPAPSVPLAAPPRRKALRVVRLFEPHTTAAPLHMALVDAYPNTPPIVSMNITLPGAEGPNGASSSAPASSPPPPQHAPPHAQIECAAGRGSASSLVRAHYGYAAKLESAFKLPMVFEVLLPLRSLAGLHHAYAQRGASHTALGSEGAGGGPRRSWHDRILLSTRQGTSVMTISDVVEADTMSGFVTSERTIAASAVQRGLGFVQVTPRGVYVLPAALEDLDEDAVDADSTAVLADLDADGRRGPFGRKRQRDAAAPPPLLASASWTHPQGKSIVAAAASERFLVVSVHQSGVTSFDFGITGTQFRVVETLPTFPDCRAVSMLSATAAAGVFSDGGAAPLSTIGGGVVHGDFVALATATHEVIIVRPRKLSEPVETIRLRKASGAGGAATAVVSSEVCSVLLTHLSSRQSLFPRLFCFVGHLDGTLTRCELDSVTGKLLDRTVLSCGKAPCQLVSGDGWYVCYVLCGRNYWRCDIRDGAQKITPMRFPKPQSFFAAFDRPPPHVIMEAARRRASGTSTRSGGGLPVGAAAAAASSSSYEELVLAVSDVTLSLFSSQAMNTSLQYSFAAEMLPVSGRRIAQHPTRPEYLIIGCTEHRGVGPADRKEMQQQLIQQQKQRSAAVAASTAGPGAAASSRTAAVLAHAAGSLTLEYRSPGQPNRYASTIQLFHKDSGRLLPPYYLNDGVGLLGMTVGCFTKDFGREPVVIISCADQFTHGSGCGSKASWRNSWLQTFRFVTAAPNPGTAGAAASSVGLLRLEAIHDTPIADIHDYPSALHICNEVGLLFVGFGEENGLHVFTWGRNKLLRKRRLSNVPSRIVSIDTVFVSPPSEQGGGGSSGSSGGVAPFYCPDLFNDNFRGSTYIAKRKRLLIACGTATQSVFLATFQPSAEAALGAVPGATLSFLMIIARDSIPRYLTSCVFVDERTVAVADRFGSVAFLRLPLDARLGLSEPWHRYTDVELNEVERYGAEGQFLVEIASHWVGQTVSTLQVRFYDPSGASTAGSSSAVNGDDREAGGRMPVLAPASATSPFRNNFIVFYGTALGGVGAYVPFASEEDAALAVYAQQLISEHARSLLVPGGVLPVTLAGRMTAAAPMYRTHNVVEGDYIRLLLESSTTAFPQDVRQMLESQLARQRLVESSQRTALGLPARSLPTLFDLAAKMRALVTLPP